MSDLENPQSPRAGTPSAGEPERYVRARDGLVAIVSHEMRTPLTTIGLETDGILRMLRAGTTPSAERLLRAAESMRRQADRLERLVVALHDAARTGLEPLDLLARKEVDLSALARTVADEAAAEAARAGSAVAVQADEPVVGQWDEARLGRIVTNLVANAIRHGEGKPITVSVERSGTSALLTVRDGGTRPDAAAQERLFDRGAGIGADSEAGMVGLSVWIVHRLVQLFGGSVTFDGRIRPGSRYTVELPLR